MIGLIKKLSGLGGPKADLGALIADGALIIDVRTEGEYAGGHLKNSVNIPLNVLPSQIADLKKEQPVITCCASGMRSAAAKRLLKSNGFTNVHNGGGWHSLQKYEK